VAEQKLSLSDSLSPQSLDSAICSAKVNLNNSVSVQITLPAVDSLIPRD